MNDKIRKVIMGGSSAVRLPAEPPVVVEGIIKEVTSDGLMFTIPAWDSGAYTYGPAPYPQGSTIVLGEPCLVVFPSGADRPWVIGVWEL